MKFMDILKQNLKIVVPVVTVAIVSVILGGLFLYNKLGTNQPVNPQLQAQDEVKKYVAEVGKLMDLPLNETPTIATVLDITKLAGQPFFQRAKNGDKVLLYPNNHKAILYDPNAKRIVETSIYNPNPATQSAALPEVTKVVLRNGTSVPDLSSKIEEKLKKEVPGIEISAKENAARTTIKTTTVSILNDAKKAQAESIAKDLNASVTILASDEAKQDSADIIVIIGTDNSKI